MKGADGAWIGWGVGDSGKPVALTKEKLRAKFSYAQALDGSELFGEDLRFVLSGFQVRKNMGGYLPVLRTDGVLDYATQVALGVVVPRPEVKPVLFTVQGTGANMWSGYPADVARRVLDLYDWQPIGNYPAEAFPMQPSIDKGVAELCLQIEQYGDRFPGRKMALSGYSQGAIVTSLVWKHHVEPPGGSLHRFKDRFIASVTWGNPARELGVAHGNAAAGWPVPEGRGITFDRLVDTPSWWFDYAHGANSAWGRDVYADVPDGPVGENMSAVWPIVASVKPMMLFKRLSELATDGDIADWGAVAAAVLYAGAFFIAKTPTEPHINYNIEPAVQYLRSAAGR